ncbi:type II toxin-antitoxin system RelE/ParE family toxin [Patescibacteria group bacterium]|nr:type II toxin-antitoxin system RelE/ParE family toxin [Patescibacteria group bacterium]
MLYKIVLPKKVQKDLKKIDNRYRQRIHLALLGLSNDPFLGKKLDGKREFQRSLIVWPYRIIYEIFEKELVVLVIRIGHRQGVYK